MISGKRIRGDSMKGCDKQATRTAAALASFIVAVLALGTAAPASRADAPNTLDGSTIVISPGERIDLKLDPAAVPAILSRGPIPAGETTPPPPTRSYETLQPTPGTVAPPKPGLFSLSLTSDATGGTILKASNGYAYPVIYSAILVLERNGQRVYQPTSICPVLPGKVGFESWGGGIVGIAINNVVGVDPQHMSCNGGSSLSETAASAQTSDRYICVGGQTPDNKSPLTVTVLTDGAGGVEFEQASWNLPRFVGNHGVSIEFDYAIVDSHVRDHPADLRVMALVGMSPPPTAKAVDIVLLQNGTEKVRRPWRLYAQSINGAMNAPNHPVAVVGIIPFPAENDPALTSVLATVGDPGSALEVQLVGDNGVVIDRSTFSLDNPATRSRAC
jgi:hypothetical protein